MNVKKGKTIEPMEEQPDKDLQIPNEDIILEGEGEEEEEDEDSGSNPPGHGPVKPPGQP